MKIKLFGKVLLIEFIDNGANWYTQRELCDIMNIGRSACYMWCIRNGYKRSKKGTGKYKYLVPKEDMQVKNIQVQLRRKRRK